MAGIDEVKELCCGNCIKFQNEDIYGCGWCVEKDNASNCGDCCVNWQQIPLNVGEAVMWRSSKTSIWKLGFYAGQTKGFDPEVYDARTGSKKHRVKQMIQFTKSNPYTTDNNGCN